MKNTEKKCRLLVTWHWSLDSSSENDAIVIDENFPTIDAAYSHMEMVMPTNLAADDGTDIEDWNDEAEPWLTFVAYPDKDHYMMAYLEPIG